MTKLFLNNFKSKTVMYIASFVALIASLYATTGASVLFVHSPEVPDELKA